MDEKELQSTVDQYVRLGRVNEDPRMLDARLHAAVESAASASSLRPKDLGVGDWAKDTIVKIKRAVHAEICDEKAGKVREKYLTLLDKGTSKEAIAWLSSAISTILVALNLGPLAVSAVVVYLAIWILKTGLNSWCSVPTSH
jgi:hypothetical protein